MIGFDKYVKGFGGYPKFKKKGVKESYRTSFVTSSYKGTIYKNIKVDLKRRIIELPKLKEIKIRGYRNLEELPGRILNATVKEVGTKFYVSVCVEEEIELTERTTNRAVGIDIGVKNLVVTSNKEYYKAYERTNGNPTFECSNTNDLYYTKIGLITFDEALYAGGITNNNYYYLYTGIYYWTMSPSYFNSVGNPQLFCVRSDGGLNVNNGVLATYGVRPVINISSDVTITGSGTINDPYLVEGA